MRNRPILAILIVCLVLRAALLAAGWRQPFERFFTPDSYDYHDLAHGLIERGQYAQTPTAPPELVRAPGYPFFLAGVYALAPWPQAGILTQIALDVLLCWLVYRFGRRMLSERAALLASAMYAISPGAVVAPLRILSDSLFAFLLTLVLMLLARCLQEQRAWRAALAGGLMGLAALVRQIGLPFLLIPAAVLALRKGRRLDAVWFILPAMLVVAPWVGRNYVAAGYPNIAGVADYNLFACNAMALVEAHPDIPLNGRQRELRALAEKVVHQRPDASELNDPDTLRACRREGLELIRCRPLEYAVVHARTAMNVFLPGSTDMLEIAGMTGGGKGTLAVLRRHGPAAAIDNYFGGNRWWLLLAAPTVLLTLLAYAAAGVGMIACPWWRLRATGWLLLLTGLYYALAPGPVANSRFRAPIEPLIALAGGAGLDWLSGRFRRKSALPDPPGGGVTA